MNKHIFSLQIFSVLLLLSLFGCTDLKKDQYTPNSGVPKVHQKGWADSSAPNFHGTVLRTQNYDYNKCVTCHAKSFTGGTSGVKCYTCHQLVPHKTGWATDTTSINFHGKYILAGMGTTNDCKTCHGTTFTGGTSGKSCYTCHNAYPHKLGWVNDTSSIDFHGKAILTDSTLTGCKTCHGTDFGGGTSGKSCYTCHNSFPHKAGWQTQSDTTHFHGKFLLTGQGHVNDCAKCHGLDFNGGMSGVSCYTCHTLFPHKQGWETDTTSANFHGKAILADTLLLGTCKTCHGTDFTGGTSQKSCYTCHNSYPHKTGWKTDTISVNFHGKFLLTGQGHNADCAKCHGADLSGGVTGLSCYTCHTTFPHKLGWNGSDTSSVNFHGKYLRSGTGHLTECVACHGTDYNGGTSNVSCYTCHASYPHKAGWQDTLSVNSHGKYLKTKLWQTAECAACHGSNYSGGSNGISCYTCHESYPHKNGWKVISDATNFHGVYLRDKRFPMGQCQSCHGNNYAGGSVVDVSCMNSGCHVDRNSAAKSPEACNTCHGDFKSPANIAFSWAPPKGVYRDSLTSYEGVGAHQNHLVTVLGKQVKCAECHTVPTQVTTPGHIGSLPFRANVVFNDTLAGLITGDGTHTPNPSFNQGTVTCNNTYCHGNFVVRKATATIEHQTFFTDSIMTGGNFSPQFNGTNQAQCGSCHGLPPTGHLGPLPLTSCGGCHNYIFDDQGNIVDSLKYKHINGLIDVYGEQKKF